MPEVTCYTRPADGLTVVKFEFTHSELVATHCHSPCSLDSLVVAYLHTYFESRQLRTLKLLAIGFIIGSAFAALVFTALIKWRL